MSRQGAGTREARDGMSNTRSHFPESIPWPFVRQPQPIASYITHPCVQYRCMQMFRGWEEGRADERTALGKNRAFLLIALHVERTTRARMCAIMWKLSQSGTDADSILSAPGLSTVSNMRVINRNLLLLFVLFTSNRLNCCTAPAVLQVVPMT